MKLDNDPVIKKKRDQQITIKNPATETSDKTTK